MPPPSTLELPLAAPAGGDSFTVAGCSIAWISVYVVVFLLFNAYIVQGTPLENVQAMFSAR